MKTLQVAAGIIVNREGLVLLAERPPGKHLAGLWEFPGGKIEPGESAESALRRELLEELELKIEGLAFLGSFPYEYEIIKVVLQVFVAKAISQPVSTEAVHVFKWINPANIVEALLAPADLRPLREYLALTGLSPQ